ncbi:MAG: hypothetical protein U9Q74_18115 [Gemmatimonadota bacterium]|nr:hypothetical protein [Gemmatimonadota bacterium]
MTARLPFAVLASLAVATAACSRDDGPRTPLAQATNAVSAQEQNAAHSLIGPAALATLDTGNVLFRKKDYTGALAKYRTAGELAPQHAAPIFGIYMVAKAMSNTKLADSALAEIRKRNGPMPEAAHGMSDSALKALHKQLGGPGTKGT